MRSPSKESIAFVDMARGEVLEVVDHGVIPLPPEKRQLPARGQRSSREDLRP